MTTARRVARLDPALYAQIQELQPIPPARAASAIRRWNDSLAIVQDDVRAVTLLRPDGSIVSLPLDERAGTSTPADDPESKATKLDLEAAVVLPDGRLLAFGSGATAMRERLVCLSPSGESRIVDARDLYRRMHDCREFSGAGLNLEGAVTTADTITLFQRGNALPGSPESISASAELPLDALLTWLGGRGAAPDPRNVVRYELGAESGISYGFTDAARLPDGRIVFLACAEAAPDAIRDGPVLGCRFGVIDELEMRIARVRYRSGAPVTAKLEGIEPRTLEPDAFDVVADPDDPALPALLGKLVVSGL